MEKFEAEEAKEEDKTGDKVKEEIIMATRSQGRKGGEILEAWLANRDRKLGEKGKEKFWI